jgi:hypothetical protein
MKEFEGQKEDPSGYQPSVGITHTDLRVEVYIARS